MFEKTTCWKCKHFKALKNGKGMKLGCPEAGRAKWTRESGFVAIGCPEYKEEL